MKLIANVTLVTQAGTVQPGGEVEIKDEAEAKSLIRRGFAVLSPAREEKQADSGGKGGKRSAKEAEQ